MKKSHLVLSWILRVLLAIGFLMACSGKLAKNPILNQEYEEWGSHDVIYFFIGILEFSLAILLLIPRTLKMAIIGLGIITIGATWIYFSRDLIPELIKPMVSALFLCSIYYINYGTKQVKEQINM